MAPARRKVQLLAVVTLTCALVAGCGSEEPPPTAGDVRTAQRAFPYPLYWAGTEVDRLPLTSLITEHVAAPTVGYGTCQASSDSGCALPVSIQTDSICDRNALAHGRAPSSSRTVRGVIARADGEGTIEIPTGVSNVTVFARPEHLRAGAGRVAAGRGHVRGTPRPGCRSRAIRSSTSTSCAACATRTPARAASAPSAIGSASPSAPCASGCAWPRSWASTRLRRPATRLRRRAVRGRAAEAMTGTSTGS